MRLAMVSMNTSMSFAKCITGGIVHDFPVIKLRLNIRIVASECNTCEFRRYVDWQAPRARALGFVGRAQRL